MKETISVLNILLPLLYFVSFGVYLLDFIKDLKKLINIKRVFLFLTLFIHIIYLLMRGLESSHPPITNVFEIFTVIAFSISFSYFILELLTDVRGTGLFIIILSLLFQLISSLFIHEQLVPEILKSKLLGSHVLSALLGYSGITISAVYGFLYLRMYLELKENKFNSLIYQRLPNLEILEKLSYYSAIIGFVMLTVAVIVGIIWLPQVPELKFSYSDPKLIGTGLVWAIYGVGIFSKFTGRLQGKKVVIFSIIGFLIAILSTIISNFVSKSFHSFTIK